MCRKSSRESWTCRLISIYGTKVRRFAHCIIQPQRFVPHQIPARLSRILTTHFGYRGVQSGETASKVAELRRRRVECGRRSTSSVRTHGGMYEMFLARRQRRERDVWHPAMLIFRETGAEEGNRQAGKHWSGRGSGARLEVRLLNIQTEVEGSALNRKEATNRAPSHIIHSHMKDGTGLKSWSLHKSVCVYCVCVYVYIIICVCICMPACKRANLPVCTCEQEADRVSVAFHWLCVRLDWQFCVIYLFCFFCSQEAPISCT